MMDWRVLFRSQACGTFVSGSELFSTDFTSTAYILTPTLVLQIADHRQPPPSSISAMSLVRMRWLPVSIDVNQPCTVAETVISTMSVTFHFKARLTPRSTASSFATLMCTLSSFFHSQLASSTVHPSIPSSEPSARLLASHHMRPGFDVDKDQTPCAGSRTLTRSITSLIQARDLSRRRRPMLFQRRDIWCNCTRRVTNQRLGSARRDCHTPRRAPYAS